ncbi:MAG: InlB B-repeat-containing protein, partial [Clostridia bacterium]|nr:InlB B-repeat-containing protein [Clostridia bacterium]
MMSKFIKGSWKRILSAVICILIIMGTCVIPSVVPASAKTFIYDKTYDFANDSGTQYGKVTLKDSSGVDRQISRAHFSINENEKLEILNDLEERSSGPSGFLFNDNEGLFELKEATSYSISLKVKLVSSQKNFVYNGVTYPTSTQITELKLAYGMPATYADNRITMDTEIGLVAEVGNNAQTFTANQNGSEVTLELGEWHTLTYDFTTPDTFGTNGNVLGFALKSFNGVHILVDDVTVTRLTSITVDPGVGTISQTSFIHKIGDKINIENPTYQFGYDFEGWYTDAACTKEFTDQYVTEENCEIKLYAGWSQTHFSFEGYTKVGQYGFNEHFYDIIEAEDAPDGKNVVQYHYTEEYWNQIRSGSVETGDAVYYSARRTQLENNISLKHVESYTTYVITFKYKLEEGSGDVYIAPATGSTNIWHTDVYVEYKDSALTLTSEVPDVWREGRMIFTTGDVSKIPGYYRNVATLRFYALGHTTTVAYLDDVRIEEATGATTVKLNANGGSFKDGSTIKNQETAIGESMFSLTYPYRENYDFAGWCYDEACTQKVESDVVDSSIYLNTLYASWSEGVGFESYYLDTEADDRSNYLSDSVTIEKTDPYMGLYSAKLVNNSSDAQHVIALNPIKNKTRYLVTFHYKLVSADYDISVRFATMNLNVNNTADLKIYDEAYTVKTDEVGKGYITGAVIIESDFANDKANRLAMLIKSEASASYTVYFDQIDVSVLKENEGYVIFADEITGDHKVQIGTVGESIKPFEPSKEAHKFLGWYTDRACTSLYEGGKNYSSVLSKVYAKWAKGESFNDSTLSSSNVSAVVDSNNKQNKYLSFTGSDEVKIATVSSGKKYGVDLRYSLISAEGNTTVTVGNQSYNVSINELGLGWTNLSFVVTADSDVFSLKVEPTNSNILIDDVIVYEITEDMSVITFKQKSGYGDDVVRIGVKGLTVDYPVIVPHGSDVFYGWYIDNTYKTPVTLSNFGGDDLTVYGRWASNPITNITFDDLDTDNPLINENNSNRAYLSNKWKYGTYSLALDRESEEEYEVYAPLANKDGYVRLESNTTYAVHFQFYYSPYTSSAKMHFNFFCASDDSYSNPIAVGEPFTGKHSYNSQYGCTYIKTGELSDSANTLYIAVTGGTKKTTLYIDSIKLTRVDEGRNHIFALDDRDKNKRVYEIDGNYGQPINFPQIDTNNYKVTGWCNDLEVTDMYEEGVHKEEPITFLYARWELNTVNFDNYQFENSNSKYTVGDDISLSREESFDTIRSLKYSYNYAIKYFETSNNVACMGRVNNKSTYRISFYYKLTETQGDVDVKFLTAHLTNRWAFITDYDEATYTIRSGEVGNDWAKATVYLTTEFATIGASGLFFTFNPRVEGDTVLYVDQVNIECIDKTAVAAFVGNEGAAVVYKEGAVGSTVAVPDSASIAQFAAFDGWYSDKELTDKISSVVLSSGVNYVYSKWNENTENFSGYSYASNSADNYSAENKIVNGALNTTVKENIFNGLRLGTINNNTSYKLTFDYKADAAATIKLASADEMSVYENATHYNDQGNYITANADNAWHTETVYFTSSFSYTVPKDEKVNTKDNKNADFGNMLYMYFEGVGANISIDNITLTEVEALYSDGASVLTEEASKEAGSQALRFFFSYKTDDIHTINIGGTDMHVVERGIIFKNARNTATGVIDGNTV